MLRLQNYLLPLQSLRPLGLSLKLRSQKNLLLTRNLTQLEQNLRPLEQNYLQQLLSWTPLGQRSLPQLRSCLLLTQSLRLLGQKNLLLSLN